MLRTKIKQWLPNSDDLRYKYKLGCLGNGLLEPNLWYFHRVTISRAAVIGLFIGSLPLPGHMIMAACLAILWSANLPFAVVSVWITNPVTLAPISYFEYKIGMWLLHRPPEHFHVHWSFQWFINEFADIWFPMFLGSLVLGATLALIAFVGIHLTWRYWIIFQWHHRKKR